MNGILTIFCFSSANKISRDCTQDNHHSPETGRLWQWPAPRNTRYTV